MLGRSDEGVQQFRILADNAPVMIWRADTTRACDFFNRPWLAFTGRTLEQELGNGWVEGVHPDDAQHCMTIYSEAFDARREFSMQYRLRRHDGVYRWLLDNGRPYFSADGGFAGYFGSCIDVTDMRETERRLRDTVARQQNMLQAMKDHEVQLAGIGDHIPGVVFRRALLPDGRMVYRYFGGAIERLLDSRLGVPGEPIPIARFARFIHPDDAKRWWDAIASSAKSQAPYRIEVRLVRLDGEIRWIRSAANVHREDDGTVVWDGVILDISDTKEYQQRLVASLHEKDVLIREVHHRVRNNMQLITSLLRLQAGEVADPQARLKLEEAELRVRSIAIAQEQLHDARNPANVDFSNYLRKLSDAVVAFHRRPDVTVQVEAGEVRLALERAVPAGLIVNELLTNGLKHAFPDGRAGRITLSAALQADGAVLIVVADDGIGVPEDISLDRPRSLGLRLVKRLAGQARATVTLDRSAGASFSVLLAP